MIRGIDPGSAEQVFNEWWDKKVEEKKGKTFQKFEDRANFQQVIAPGVATGENNVNKVADKFGF